MPERATVKNRSEKSAEAVVNANKERRAEREGKPTLMSLGRAQHQKPGEPGRAARRQGEALSWAERDETRLTRDEPEGLGQVELLTQALARANMVMAWKRVKANRGSAGVDGLTIMGTADYLKTHWLRIRDALQTGRYRPLPVRRVHIPKAGGRHKGIRHTDGDGSTDSASPVTSPATRD